MKVNLPGNGQPETQVMAEKAFEELGQLGVFCCLKEVLVNFKIKVHDAFVAAPFAKRQDPFFVFFESVHLCGCDALKSPDVGLDLQNHPYFGHFTNSIKAQGGYDKV